MTNCINFIVGFNIEKSNFIIVKLIKVIVKLIKAIIIVSQIITVITIDNQAKIKSRPKAEIVLEVIADNQEIINPIDCFIIISLRLAIMVKDW